MLRLGIIGLSPGNGHPYSWSAIFNGYDPIFMKDCGFPAIPEYLEKQNFPEDALSEATVTHVWTQDLQLSHHIAKATNIEHVASTLYDLTNSVDGILLARDDAETHLEIAQPFLEAGLPIYIDKPLALSISEAEKLISLQKYPGQIFSCSALRYAPELQLTLNQREAIGSIMSIWAFTPKDWNKYSIHVVEPLLQLIPDCGEVKDFKVWEISDRKSLALKFQSGIDVHIHSLGRIKSPLGLRVYGEKGYEDLLFQNTFRAFRTALHEFILGILNKDIRISTHEMLKAIEIVEMGISL